MKQLRLFAALFVAIGSLFLATPAQASSFTDWSLSYNTAYDANTDCVVFSYTWGSASKSYLVPENVQNVQNVQFDVTVNNSITNKIGGNGEVFDSYSLEMEIIEAGVVVDTVTYAENSTKHFAELRTLTSSYTGPADSVNVTIRGIDNGFWGGYYGPIVCGASLTATSQDQPAPQTTTTPEPTALPTETPSSEPEITPTPQETPTPSPTPSATTAPQNSISGAADEGWDLTLTAPNGFVFSEVHFASYGVPDNYTEQWCHAATSVQKVAEAFIGQTTATIASNNGVFGDPCGGTYKRLQVILIYEPLVPVVVPTPEPPVVVPPIVEPTPTPTPTEEPTVVPTPTPSPTQTTSPTPSETPKPTPIPTTPVATPTPTPEPSKTPEEPTTIISKVDLIDPKSLSTEEVTVLVAAAESVLAVAEQGSEVYQQALEALAVAAVADDPELPAELEAIPGAAEVLAAFNALGNVGADMAPKVRETAEKTVIASVIGVQAAVSAVTATTAVTATSSNTVRRTQ